MLLMTWNDLKLFVDDALAADGRDGSVKISYIDVAVPSLDSELFKPEVAISDSRLVVFN